MPSGPESISIGQGTAPPIPASRARAAGAASRPLEDLREAAARRYLILSAAAFAVILGIVWAYSALLPMAFLPRDYPAWIAKRRMLESCELGAVSFYGDSRAMAGIVPRALPFAGSNFAFSGSSPIEAYFALERALRCKGQPKAVVIAYSAGKYTDDNDYWAVSARMGILDFAALRAVQAKSVVLHDDEVSKLPSRVNAPPLIREVLYATRFPTVYFDSIVNGYVFGRYFYNHHAERDILQDRGQAFFGTANGSDSLASESAMPNLAVSPIINAYFTEMLADLARRNIPAILMSLPINDATCRKINPAVRTAFSNYLRRRIASVPDAKILGPVMPCWPDRFFGDAFHLNSAGAARFTQLAAGWLEGSNPKLGNAAQLVER